MSNEEKIRILQEGADSPFWNVITEAMRSSIEPLQELLKDKDGMLAVLPAEEYKVRNELLKAKIFYLEKLIETPSDYSRWLEAPSEKKGENFDPYLKPEEL
jgi:hypothetical protein